MTNAMITCANRNRYPTLIADTRRLLKRSGKNVPDTHQKMWCSATPPVVPSPGKPLLLFAAGQPVESGIPRGRKHSGKKY
eukprot:scaffold48_cov311-Pinguiococcus_pyrenoidosus.AAC.272